MTELPQAEPTMSAPPSSTTTTQPLHTLPPPFTTSALTPLTQGAEALVYETTFLTPSLPALLKYRPPKPYRHPILDRRLTKARLLAEGRVLVKCKKEGVNVPGVLAADWEQGWLVMEFVSGRTVRNILDEELHNVTVPQNEQVVKEEVEKEEVFEEELWDLMRRVGRAVGRLHEVGVCHGDLTTSNLMVRDVSTGGKEEVAGAPRGRQTVSAMREAADMGLPPPAAQSSSHTPGPSPLSGEVVLIDFGLATQSIQDEDRAVDLYVLERAFAATHPAAEPLFKEVLKSYGGSFGGARVVLRRLEDVRMRGRKKSMVG